MQTNRLQQVVHFVINNDQAGFIKTGEAADNIRAAFDLIDLNKNKAQVILMLL